MTHLTEKHQPRLIFDEHFEVLEAVLLEVLVLDSDSTTSQLLLEFF